MKLIGTLIASVFIFISSNAGAFEVVDASQAIKVAGTMRMLSQRIVKAYCQLGINESYGEPAQQIKDGITLFENDMEQLKPFIGNGDAAAAAAEVKQEWGSYKELATTPPSHENALKLFVASEQLLTSTQKVVDAIQVSIGPKRGALIDASGRQIMLSQRMAMFHMLKLWGIADKTKAQKAEDARKQFVEIQTRLLQEPRNTADINNNLSKVVVSHKLLEHSLASPESLSYTVAMTSEKIMTMMDATATAYVSMNEQSKD